MMPKSSILYFHLLIGIIAGEVANIRADIRITEEKIYYEQKGNVWGK